METKQRTDAEIQESIRQSKIELAEYHAKNREFRKGLDRTPYGTFYNSLIDEMLSWHHNILPLSESFRIFNESLKARSPQPEYFMGTALSHRNIAQVEGGMNLKMQGSFEVTPTNLDEVTREMSSRTFAFYIMQGFEIFETFLLNVFATYYDRHYHVLEAKFKKLKGSPIAPKGFVEIRLHIKKNIGNHADFFEILERESPFFKTHSIDNIWDKNLRSVARLLSTCRNIITHNRMRVTMSLENYLQGNPHAHDMFYQLFDIIEADGEKVITTTHAKARVAISAFVEMAELIMRGVTSIDPPPRLNRLSDGLG